MAQGQFDFKRGEQLRIMRDCELADGRSPDGKLVKASVQKAVLRAIDDHGRFCTASYDTLAREANISRRHCVRAIDLMVSRSQLIRENQRSSRGYQQLRLIIVWNELLLKCSDDLARRFGVSAGGTNLDAPPNCPSAPGGTKPDALAPKPSAPVTRPSALGAKPSALAHGPSAPRGTLSVLSAIEPPQPPLLEAWAAVADEFWGQLPDVVSLCERWEALGRSPGELRAAILEARQVASLPANAKRLTSPDGAIDRFLRTGRWPIEGIVSIDDQAAIDQRAEEQRRGADEAAALAAQEQRLAAESRQALEERYGPIADGLDEAGAAELLPFMGTMGAGCLRRNSSPPWSFSTRIALIRAMEKRDLAGVP